MNEIKIYFAGKFDFSANGEKLEERLKNDYRSILLGDSKKLTYADEKAKLNNYPIHYNGCFYCEQASNGDYTSTDCKFIVRQEIKSVIEADIFCCVFDLDFSVGTIVELMDAAFAKKRIAIFFRNVQNSYEIKSEYWFAITRAIEICKSNNTIIEIFDYNDSVLPVLHNWLSNLVFTKKYVCIRFEKLEENLKEFTQVGQMDFTNKKVLFYESNNNKIIIETYKTNLIIVKALNEIHNKGLIDVTNNAIYEDINIEKGNIICNAIIEGTDGVGKTTTIIELIKQGIVCQDRSKIICDYMLFDVLMEDRCSAYKNYLDNTNDFVIFLVNNSKEELESRINKRETISTFDKKAYEYNMLYEETYLKMKELNLKNPIELINCTGLSISEQEKAVKDCILRRNRYE